MKNRNAFGMMRKEEPEKYQKHLFPAFLGRVYSANIDGQAQAIGHRITRGERWQSAGRLLMAEGAV